MPITSGRSISERCTALWKMRLPRSDRGISSCTELSSTGSATATAAASSTSPERVLLPSARRL